MTHYVLELIFSYLIGTVSDQFRQNVCIISCGLVMFLGRRNSFASSGQKCYKRSFAGAGLCTTSRQRYVKNDMLLSYLI